MDKTLVLIAAGMLSRSNMGMGHPELDTVKDARKYPPKTISSAVMRFCEQFMETDEHQSMFEEEGAMWVKILEDKGEEESRQSWPDIFKLIDEADPKIAG